ncbi:hypothetical protein BP5796_07698 [Coleophoma crateriformis]|uniref:Profilin n=1 Tax=Coleophoma crateriformis TaxID=565419 RepID=A0A3D8RCR5_9HELO|nr:hypothetical protein BP5796_07698 [Coleophoma crateriformis]
MSRLVRSGRVDGAAIIGADDGSIWATSHTNSFQVRQGEGSGAVELFKHPEDVFNRGITLNGVKYMGIKGDERSIYAKKA